jgi:hypothetical protein
MRRLALFIAVLLAAAVVRPAEAQRADVIRGRIIGPDSQPVNGATIRATSYMGNVTRPAKTDKNGRFTIIFPNGEGDYWIEVTAIGLQPKRFEIKRIAEEEILIADAKLASNIATLDAVNVTANAARAMVSRADAGTDVSGTDKTLTTAGLPPELAGNLAAMASMLPGIQLIPGLDGAADMFSVLGLGGDQNNTTFNGLGSSLSALPRDAQTNASVRTFNYDPAVGGFGGAQISLYTIPGSNFSRRNMSGLGRGPDTEWTSEIAEEQGAKSTWLSAGGFASGPLTFDKHFYNVSWQADRGFNDLHTLLNTSAAGLNAAGVSRDSAQRLLSILSAENVPAAVSRAPRLQATNNYLVQGNFDITPNATGTGHAFNLSLGGNYSQTDNVGAGQVLTVPGRYGESNRMAGNVALRHSNYFWFGVLSTTTVGVSAGRNETQPYLRMPSGTVRVSSALEDGTTSIRSLQFGGNPANQSGSNTSFEFLNQMKWYEGNNRHIVTLTTNLRRESYETDQSSNLLGSFVFNSLADLEAGVPASYSRALSPRTREGSQLVGSVALGDAWRPSPTVQVQMGVRLDGNRFLSRPSFNPAIDSVFALRNDRVPNRIYASPRLGFQWIYGTAQQLAVVPGAARPPRALIQGGIGVFQNLSGAGLIGSALDQTGLPSGAQSMSCVGEAAPVPDWNAYRLNPATIRTECADGSRGTVFATGAPSVALFDSQFRQSRVLRSNIGWGGPILSNRFALGLSLQYQRGLNQSGSIDINFDSTAQFTLDDEGGRPVYATPGAIVPTTGVIAIRDTRASSAFNRVNVQRSDLQQETRLFSVNLKPVINPRCTTGM